MGSHISESRCGIPACVRTWQSTDLLRCWFVSHGLRQLVSAPECGPVGFDLDDTNFSGCVVIETRPAPIAWLGDESADDRVAVHGAELFDALFFVVHIEVVVAPLPELRD